MQLPVLRRAPPLDGRSALAILKFLICEQGPLPFRCALDPTDYVACLAPGDLIYHQEFHYPRD